MRRLRRVQTGMGSGTRSITTKAATTGGRRAKRERGTSWRPAPEPKASGPDQPILEHLLRTRTPPRPDRRRLRRPPTRRRQRLPRMEAGSVMGDHITTKVPMGPPSGARAGTSWRPVPEPKASGPDHHVQAQPSGTRHLVLNTGGRTPSAPASGRRCRPTGCGPRRQGGSVLALPDTPCRDLDIPSRQSPAKPVDTPL